MLISVSAGNLRSSLFPGMRRRADLDHLALGPMKRPTAGPWTTERPFHDDSIQDKSRSGYQGLRLATELFPGFLGVHGADKVSPFWSSLFYLSLLLFGIAQQVNIDDYYFFNKFN